MRRHPMPKGYLVFLLRGLLLCIVSLLYLSTTSAGAFFHTRTAQVHPSSPTATPTPTPACKQQTFQTGVVFPRWTPKGYGASDTKWLSQLAVIRQQTAACWLGMPLLFFQDTPSSTHIKAKRTPTVANFTHGIRTAHALGYRIFVTPLINIHGPHWWAGSIRFSTYEEEQKWFESYWQVLKPYVTAAAQEGVEQLAIGTEEEWLQSNAPDSLWNGLIANIRSVFSGTLTYDTNWSALQTEPPAWMQNPELKMIGVSAYFSLVETPIRVDPEQISALWKEKAQPLLDNFATKLGKPIFLSEVGYRNSSDALYHAWEWRTSAPADPEEQAAAYDAVLVNSLADPHIVGTFFWGWDAVGAFGVKGQSAVGVLYKRYAPLQESKHT